MRVYEFAERVHEAPLLQAALGEHPHLKGGSGPTHLRFDTESFTSSFFIFDVIYCY